MTKIGFTCASIAAVIAISPCTPLHAQDARTWVASYGGGTTCTRDAPCKDFQTAHNATDDGGEINCADAGDFTQLNTTLTISKSITIDCAGALGAHTFENIHVGGDGIVVRLRNLSLQGVRSGSVGVNFITGAALYVEHCTIYAWQSGSSGDGILFAPPAGVRAKLVVTDSFIEYNGGAFGNGGGILIQPGSGVKPMSPSPARRSRTTGSAFLPTPGVEHSKAWCATAWSRATPPGALVPSARRQIS